MQLLSVETILPDTPVFVTVTVWPVQIVESVTVKLAVGKLLTVIGLIPAVVMPQAFWAVIVT